MNDLSYSHDKLSIVDGDGRSNFDVGEWSEAGGRLLPLDFECIPTRIRLQCLGDLQLGSVSHFSIQPHLNRVVCQEIM